MFCHISREMRTSLDGIMGFIHLLSSQHSGRLNEKQSRYVSEIYENGKQLNSLVNDCLDLARLDSGMLDLNFAELNVNEYLLWALDVLQPQLNEKNLKFTINWKTAPEKILGDSARVKQILFILLSRVVGFSLKNERILLSVEFDKNFFKVSVSNDYWSGIDIKTPEPENYFQPIDLNDQRSSDFDVSLALVLKLIQLHDGDIGLDQEENGQSKLWFTLSKNSHKQAGMPGLKTNPVKNFKKNAPRILLVDDSSKMQTLVTEILKREQFKVFVADNGQAGLELAQQCHPDLIFMDINMPVMDGVDAFRGIRAVPGLETIPVVALTACELDDSRERLLGMGFTSYLSKPFSRDDLLGAVQKSLGLPPSD
ncbi:MAG: response regulator [Nitrospinota bacterium]|nr:response regulator [Nitrospinota bacterium]